MEVGGMRVNMANDTSVAILSKSLDIQESLSNQLIQGGLEAASTVRAEAMHSQGKGTIVDTVA